VLLLCEFRNRELLYSPGPQHSCRPSPQWHVVHSGGSTSPSVTSSGPTTLACLLDSLARGTHSCTHIHSKQNPTVRSPLRSTTQIFSAFRGFGHREFVHPTSRTSICRNPKITVYSSAESDGQLPSYDLRCRSFRDFGFRVSEVFTSLTSHLPTLRNPKGFRD
jgi:hypothetical protein